MKFFRNRFKNYQHNHHNHDAAISMRHKILAALLSQKALGQKELLSAIAEKTPPDVLAELQREGLVNCKQNLFSLTPEGRIIAERHREQRQRFTMHMSGNLNEEEQAQFNAILENICQSGEDDDFAHFHFRGSHFRVRDTNEDDGEAGKK